MAALRGSDQAAQIHLFEDEQTHGLTMPPSQQSRLVPEGLQMLPSIELHAGSEPGQVEAAGQDLNTPSHVTPW